MFECQSLISKNGHLKFEIDCSKLEFIQEISEVLENLKVKSNSGFVITNLYIEFKTPESAPKKDQNLETKLKFLKQILKKFPGVTHLYIESLDGEFTNFLEQFIQELSQKGTLISLVLYKNDFNSLGEEVFNNISKQAKISNLYVLDEKLSDISFVLGQPIFTKDSISILPISRYKYQKATQVVNLITSEGNAEVTTLDLLDGLIGNKYTYINFSNLKDSISSFNTSDFLTILQVKKDDRGAIPTIEELKTLFLEIEENKVVFLDLLDLKLDFQVKIIVPSVGVMAERSKEQPNKEEVSKKELEEQEEQNKKYALVNEFLGILASKNILCVRIQENEIYTLGTTSVLSKLKGDETSILKQELSDKGLEAINKEFGKKSGLISMLRIMSQGDQGVRESINYFLLNCLLSSSKFLYVLDSINDSISKSFSAKQDRLFLDSRLLHIFKDTKFFPEVLDFIWSIRSRSLSISTDNKIKHILLSSYSLARASVSKREGVLLIKEAIKEVKQGFSDPKQFCIKLLEDKENDKELQEIKKKYFELLEDKKTNLYLEKENLSTQNKIQLLKLFMLGDIKSLFCIGAIDFSNKENLEFFASIINSLKLSHIDLSSNALQWETDAYENFFIKVFNQVSSLDLGSMGILDIEAEGNTKCHERLQILRSCLVKNQLNRLTFSGNCVDTPEKIDALDKDFIQAQPIRYLDLSWNGIGSNIENIKALEQLLKNNPSILYLNISNNEIFYHSSLEAILQIFKDTNVLYLKMNNNGSIFDVEAFSLLQDTNISFLDMNDCLPKTNIFTSGINISNNMDETSGTDSIDSIDSIDERARDILKKQRSLLSLRLSENYIYKLYSSEQKGMVFSEITKQKEFDYMKELFDDGTKVDLTNMFKEFSSNSQLMSYIPEKLLEEITAVEGSQKAVTSLTPVSNINQRVQDQEKFMIVSKIKCLADNQQTILVIEKEDLKSIGELAELKQHFQDANALEGIAFRGGCVDLLFQKPLFVKMINSLPIKYLSFSRSDAETSELLGILEKIIGESITDLDLSYNSINSTEDIQKLSDIIDCCKNLKFLNLGCNGIQDKDSFSLLGRIVGTKKIENLDISGNYLGHKENILNFSKASDNFQNLKCLNVRDNYIYSKESLQIFMEWVKKLQLKYLNISNNYINTLEKIEVLNIAFQNLRITNIDISDSLQSEYPLPDSVSKKLVNLIKCFPVLAKQSELQEIDACKVLWSKLLGIIEAISDMERVTKQGVCDQQKFIDSLTTIDKLLQEENFDLTLLERYIGYLESSKLLKESIFKLTKESEYIQTFKTFLNNYHSLRSSLDENYLNLKEDFQSYQESTQLNDSIDINITIPMISSLKSFFREQEKFILDKDKDCLPSLELMEKKLTILLDENSEVRLSIPAGLLKFLEVKKMFINFSKMHDDLEGVKKDLKEVIQRTRSSEELSLYLRNIKDISKKLREFSPNSNLNQTKEELFQELEVKIEGLKKLKGYTSQEIDIQEIESFVLLKGNTKEVNFKQIFNRIHKKLLKESLKNFNKIECISKQLYGIVKEESLKELEAKIAEVKERKKYTAQEIAGVIALLKENINEVNLKQIFDIRHKKFLEESFSNFNSKAFAKIDSMLKLASNSEGSSKDNAFKAFESFDWYTEIPSKIKQNIQRISLCYEELNNIKQKLKEIYFVININEMTNHKMDEICKELQEKDEIVEFFRILFSIQGSLEKIDNRFFPNQIIKNLLSTMRGSIRVLVASSENLSNFYNSFSTILGKQENNFLENLQCLREQAENISTKISSSEEDILNVIEFSSFIEDIRDIKEVISKNFLLEGRERDKRACAHLFNGIASVLNKEEPDFELLSSNLLESIQKLPLAKLWFRNNFIDKPNALSHLLEVMRNQEEIIYIDLFGNKICNSDNLDKALVAKDPKRVVSMRDSTGTVLVQSGKEVLFKIELDKDKTIPSQEICFKKDIISLLMCSTDSEAIKISVGNFLIKNFVLKLIPDLSDIGFLLMDKESSTKEQFSRYKVFLEESFIKAADKESCVLAAVVQSMIAMSQNEKFRRCSSVDIPVWTIKAMFFEILRDSDYELKKLALVQKKLEEQISVSRSEIQIQLQNFLEEYLTSKLAGEACEGGFKLSKQDMITKKQIQLLAEKLDKNVKFNYENITSGFEFGEIMLLDLQTVIPENRSSQDVIKYMKFIFNQNTSNVVFFIKLDNKIYLQEDIDNVFYREEENIEIKFDSLGVKEELQKNFLERIFIYQDQIEEEFKAKIAELKDKATEIFSIQVLGEKQKYSEKYSREGRTPFLQRT